MPSAPVVTLERPASSAQQALSARITAHPAVGHDGDGVTNRA